MEVFAQRLREVREEAGLNITQLARMIGTGHQSVSKWEEGTYVASGQLLVNLCKVLNVSADYLLGITNERD